MKTFNNFPALTSALAFDLIDMIKARTMDGADVYAEFGKSNVSPSAYVEVSACDEGGDEIFATKVRFSDHGDRHGSDITIRIDRAIHAIEEDGEYVATEISEEDYAALLLEAFNHVLEKAS